MAFASRRVAGYRRYSTPPKPPNDLLSSLSASPVRYNWRNPPPLHPLSRPLGVRERPSPHRKTISERIDKYVNPNKFDELMQDRRHLASELVNFNVRGGYNEIARTTMNGGKTWIAPKTLIREDKALYFPNIIGKCLLDGEEKHTTSMCFGKVTVLCLLNTRISEIHCKGFTDSTYTRYHSNPHFQMVQINLQENLIKALIVKMFSYTLRQSVPPELQSNYLISNQNLEHLYQYISYDNGRVGYVYLIDENLKIRWAGCAEARPEEAQSLEIATGVLLGRIEKEDQSKLQTASA